MTLHSIVQYVKYKWKAKGRHGVHSPFVYAFIEDGLQKIKAPSLQYLLKEYFGENAIVFVEDAPSLWMQNVPGCNDKIIAIKGIHCTAQHTQAWQQLVNDKRIMLSIDLFEYGLLFFNTGFKEKQHFIISA